MLKINKLVEDIDIESMATIASNVCRFRGKFKFFTLAEHLCLCYDLAKKHASDDKEYLRMIFSHDWSELAALSDVVKPCKDSVFVAYDGKITSLDRFEHELNQAIYIKIFGQPRTWNHDYKPIDNLALFVEIEYHGGKIKEKYSEKVKEALEYTDIRGEGWAPERAREEFLSRYESVKTDKKELIHAV